jgi:hypothetical protein
MWIVPGHAEGDLMRVCFPNDERASLFEFFDNERVLFGNILCKEF